MPIMRPQELDALAEIMISASLDTLSYSKEFLGRYDFPPTLFGKVHHWRSVVQAIANRDDRFDLHPDYAEFGRVQVTDTADGNRYLLRSKGAVTIERAKQQEALFDATHYLRSDVVLIGFGFRRDGMDLSFAGTRQMAGKKRLEASGPLTYIGTWPWVTSDGAAAVFDQGDLDFFGDLGEIAETGEGEVE